jgi:hypothetical protein
MTKPDDDGELMPVQSIQLAVLRANTKARVYYKGSYTEGESDGQRPTCASTDGLSPDQGVMEPQAKKCQACKHAVWGSKVKDDGTLTDGTECSVNTRLAVADPDHLETALLLRVPAGSRKNFADAVKVADTRGIPYNALVLRVAFDPTAPSPKLTFKPVGLLDDVSFGKATAAYDSEIVREIVGLNHRAEEDAAPSPAVDSDELDAAIAAKAVTTKAAAKPAAKAKAAPAPAVDESDIDAALNTAVAAPPAPVPAPAPAPKPKPAPKPEVVPAASDMDNLLGDLDSLLGNTDD